MNVDLMKILKKCKKCDKKLTVAEVAYVAQNSFALLYHEGTALKRIEKRLGEKDWNILVTSITGTFLSSLYATAELSEDPEKAIKFGKEIGAKSVALVKEKDDE